MWGMMNDNFEMNNEFCDVMKETLEVLKNVEGEFFKKLPEHIKECLIKYSEKSDKKISLDMSKRLNEQDISEECKDLLSIIYYVCCDNEDEKKELLECWNKNM